jgi:NADH-quinone oxidoreductase subunit A
LTFEGLFSMIFFLFLLTLGFIYEWYEGALDWS